MSNSKLVCVAYYLGQFHPIAENNKFWAPGFTEWHNVAQARPLYPGHAQPKLPGKFGFYDLRCVDTLIEQIRFSHEIGITAFCHWHYWFSGKHLLHRPLDDMLKLNYPGHTFMLGWANETWSGVWHGAADRVLIEQSYSKEEIVDHAKLVAAYIDSGQYLKINGKCPFVIYKPKQIPNAMEYLSEFKRLVSHYSGAELYMIGNWTPGRSGEVADPSTFGLDAVVITPVAAYFKSPVAQTIYSGLWQSLRKFGIGPEVRDYAQVSSTLERAIQSIQGTAHATIVTGWDNTPRSGRRGLVLAKYNKESFKKAARHALAMELRNDHPLLFIKSWNEWAEGNMIEPEYREIWSSATSLKEILQSA